MKAPAWQLAAGHQWCQTCKEWIPPTEGGHRLDHWLERHLDQLLWERERAKR